MADTQDTGTVATDAGVTQGTEAGAGTGAPNTGASTTTDAGTAADNKGQATETKDVEYTFEAPEGIELDQAQVDEFKAIAKELNLPAEAAKKIADIQIRAAVARSEAFAKQVETWGEEVAKDPELGKAENQAAMRKVVESFGTPELKSLLNSTGLGNHPELARFAFRISKAISEDAILGKATGEAAPKDTASVLYPTTAKA